MFVHLEAYPTKDSYVTCLVVSECIPPHNSVEWNTIRASRVGNKTYPSTPVVRICKSGVNTKAQLKKEGAGQGARKSAEG